MPVASLIQTRNGTAAAWTTANPTLAVAERGYETDSKKYKTGDGSTVWTALPYDGAANQPIIENVNAVATAGAAQTVPEPVVQTISRYVLTAALTFTFPTAVAGKSFTIITVQDATARAVTWPVSVKWPGGTAPTLTATSGKSDVFTFACVDGTNWLGFVAGQNL